LKAVEKDWMSRPGVISVEVARVWRDDGPTDDVGIRVTVEKARPGAEPPGRASFPETLEDVEVQVMEGDRPEPQG
jgi:hypothetical protein